MTTGDEKEENLIVYNRKLKKAILDVMFREVETFYVHCMPNPRLAIGKRGLVDKEDKEGIILVFGPYSTRHLSWDDDYIFCDMQFGRWEQVSIPYECIARIFDKSGQVIMQWATMTASDDEEKPESGSSTAETTEPVGARVDTLKPPAPTEVETSDETPKTPAATGGDGQADESRVIQVDFTRKKKD